MEALFRSRELWCLSDSGRVGRGQGGSLEVGIPGGWLMALIMVAVLQVKFMKSKPGAAMVEMADGYAVDRAITHLNNNFMFGQKLNVW